ncbi:response regulator [Gorillibacterium timonense]|uniref:response regulator n=1 Tax=Gorillibacterium timonense TaxID=1689269 RepID=UPI00071D1A4A|nr:response regulator [Gorillibacterium timonense]
MYKVMIVDDEPIIRMGIRASVDWTSKGLEMIGDYSNGEAALEALSKEQADILITDIKMPLMDGLELTRRAMERYPGIKVILISSYNDFQYVRQGIVLGAMDYILKLTMEPEELLSVLDRCVEAIEKERIGAGVKGTWRNQLLMADRKNAERGLGELIRNGSCERVESFLPEAFDQGCTMASLIVDRAEELKQANGYLFLSMMVDELKRLFYKRFESGVAIATKENELLLLIPIHFSLPNELKNMLEAETGLRLTMGYVNEVPSDRLTQKIAELEKAHTYRFYRGSGGIYRIGERWSSDGWQAPDVFCRANSLATHHQMTEAEGSAAEPLQQLARKAQEWGREQKEPERVKREACDFFSALYLKELEPKLALEYYQDLMSAETLNELVDSLVVSIRECESGRSGEGKPSSNQLIVDKAEEFLAKHFTEGITLQMVADHVHVSKNYFSFLYKKQTSHTFIDQLIHLRIERAKELLRHRDLKIYEIAEQAGFNDVKYFSKLFKKLTGSSPVDYRIRLDRSEEGGSCGSL